MVLYSRFANDLDVSLGLIGYWKLDDNKDGSLTAINQYLKGDGTFTGGAINSVGQGFRDTDVINYDGNNQYTQLNEIDNTYQLGLGDFSIAVRVKFVSVSQNNIMIDKRDSNNNGYFFGWINGQGVVFAFFNDDTIGGLSSIEAGKWYDIAYCKKNIDASTSKAIIYVNGEDVTTTQPIINNVSADMRFGIDSYDLLNDMNGQMTRVRIYDRCICQQEAKRIWRNRL